MQVATWNVNSIRARSDLVAEWLADQRPDVCCLQETKCTDDDFPFDVFEGIGYQQDSTDANLTMNPHGVEDVNAATKTVREATDSYLAIGEQYMAGSTLLTCTQILEDNLPVNGRPWDGTKI